MTIKIVFYSTSGYHSGHDANTYVDTGANVFPYASGLGYNVGFTSLSSLLFRNNSTSVDHRLGGDVRTPAWTVTTYQVTLPSAGDYDIALALGTMNSSPSAVHAKMFDNTTQIGSTIGLDSSVANGAFYDASGVERTSDSAWVSDNVLVTRTFGSTTFKLEFQGGGNTKLAAHIGLYPADSGLTVITGLATETNSAFAITRRKIRSIALSTETDTAFSVSGGAAPVTVVTGLATESDSAFSIARTKIRSVSLSLEVDSAFNVTRRKVRSVALTTETDTALAVARIKRRLTDLAQETETAISLESGSITVVTGLASESDSAFAVNRRKLRTISLSLESDSALAVRAQRWKSIGLGLETDTAFNVSILPHVLIGQAEESDSALPVAALSYTLVGMAVETNTAFPLVKVAVVLPRYEVLRYTPQNIPEISDENIRKVFTYVLDEYARLANMLDLLAKGHVELTFKAPNKPYEGMTRLADGTYWNPGSGKGVYVYFDGTWNKVS